MRLSATLAALSAIALLAGCGGGDSSGPGGGANVAAGKSDDWGKDACKTYPVAAVAKAAGIPLATAGAGTSGTPVEGVNVSTCSYKSADEKQIVTIGLRQDLEGGRTMAGEIGSLQGMPEVTGPTEVIAMPKGQAVWQPKLRTLTWIPDPDRLITITPWGLKIMDESDPVDVMKARALQIAKGLGD